MMFEATLEICQAVVFFGLESCSIQIASLVCFSSGCRKDARMVSRSADT